MNGERLCGILHHVHTCKVSKTQTLQKVETTSNTLLTMVVYLNGLLCYPSSHQPFNEAGNIHTCPRHCECSTSSTAIPHPCILQTQGPITHNIRLRFGFHNAFFPL